VPTLLRDSHFVLERYDSPAFIRLARTALPLRTLQQITTSLSACRAALGAIEPAGLGLLLDWRLSAAPNEALLRQQLVSETQAFAAPFARVALLLLTAAPHQGEAPASALWAGSALQTFHDEEAAIAHVVIG
jgi:hypothetical protein